MLVSSHLDPKNPAIGDHYWPEYGITQIYYVAEKSYSKYHDCSIDRTNIDFTATDFIH